MKRNDLILILIVVLAGVAAFAATRTEKDAALAEVYADGALVWSCPLDEDGTFEQRCNMAQVSLEPLPEEIAARKRSESGDELESHGRVDIDHLTMGDELILKGLIERHVRFAGSVRAREILNNWGVWRKKFVKVFPHEYRRALAERAARAGAVEATERARASAATAAAK